MQIVASCIQIVASGMQIVASLSEARLALATSTPIAMIEARGAPSARRYQGETS
jgi:hypothetical protein